MSDFNYGDTLALTRLAKKVLVTAGYVSEKLEGPWDSVDEFNWKSYCDKMGGKFTPFPEIGIQPDNIKEEFELLENEVESITHSAQYPELHRDLIINAYKQDRTTGKFQTQINEMDHPEPKKSKPGSVNFGILQGSMSRFTGKESVSDHDKIHAPNPDEMAPPSNAGAAKRAANIKVRNADGKEVQAGKDILSKVNDPLFDSSAPPKTEMTEKQKENAPDTTDLSSHEGTEDERKAKEARLQKQTSIESSTSVR